MKDLVFWCFGYEREWVKNAGSLQGFVSTVFVASILVLQKIDRNYFLYDSLKKNLETSIILFFSWKHQKAMMDKKRYYLKWQITV